MIRCFASSKHWLSYTITLHVMNINKVKRVTTFLTLISNLELTCFGATILLALHWNQWNIQRYPKYYKSLQAHYILVNHGRICQHVVNVLKSLLKSPNAWSLSKQLLNNFQSGVSVCVFVVNKVLCC